MKKVFKYTAIVLFSLFAAWQMSAFCTQVNELINTVSIRVAYLSKDDLNFEKLYDIFNASVCALAAIYCLLLAVSVSAESRILAVVSIMVSVVSCLLRLIFDMILCSINHDFIASPVIMCWLNIVWALLFAGYIVFAAKVKNKNARIVFTATVVIVHIINNFNSVMYSLDAVVHLESVMNNWGYVLRFVVQPILYAVLVFIGTVSLVLFFVPGKHNVPQASNGQRKSTSAGVSNLQGSISLDDTVNVKALRKSLLEYRKMFEEGVITETEYEEKRQQILKI